jgi:hypothetical protein
VKQGRPEAGGVAAVGAAGAEAIEGPRIR